MPGAAFLTDGGCRRSGALTDGGHRHLLPGVAGVELDVDLRGLFFERLTEDAERPQHARHQDDEAHDHRDGREFPAVDERVDDGEDRFEDDELTAERSRKTLAHLVPGEHRDPRAEEAHHERNEEERHGFGAHEVHRRVHEADRPREEREGAQHHGEHRHALKRRPGARRMVGVLKKPVGVVDREPGPGEDRGDAEADADPEGLPPAGARFRDHLEFGPVGDDEPREDDGQGRQDAAPGNRAPFLRVADVGDDGDQHRNHGHEHAGQRGARHADADREHRVEDHVAEERKLERLPDVGAGELFEFMAQEPKAGQRHDPEGDEAPERHEHGVVLRYEKRGDVDEAPESTRSDAQKNTDQHW